METWPEVDIARAVVVDLFALNIAAHVHNF